MLKTCVLLTAILAASAAAAQSCPGLAGAVKVESERYVVAYRTRPDRIAVGQHFTMDVMVCPRGGSRATAESLSVDAHMPEHRHGMNYRTTVKPDHETTAKAVGGARYLAEGFMFHMPGRWEFIFEVRADGKTDRVTRSVTVE